MSYSEVIKILRIKYEYNYNNLMQRPTYQRQIESTATQYTRKILLKKQKLRRVDENAFLLLQIIQQTIKDKLRTLDCFCHTVGRYCEIFGFLEKWKCSNCTRNSLYVKYRDYEKEYRQMIKSISTADPNEPIIIGGQRIQNNFDRKNLLELLHFKKDFIKTLKDIAAKELKRFDKEFRRFGKIQASKRKQMPECQSQSERTAGFFTQLIRLKKAEINKQTLNIHQKIQNCIKSKLKTAYDCYCREVGSNIEVFGRLYNWYCLNCHRKSLILKYMVYQEYYGYAIDLLSSENPQSISQLIGVPVESPFDNKILIDLLDLQKKFIHCLWSHVHKKEQKVSPEYKKDKLLKIQKRKIIHKDIEQRLIRRGFRVIYTDENQDPNTIIEELEVE